MSTFVRQEPRFIDEKAVEIEFGSREELQEAWTVDISKGGMFLRTDTPPAFGTRLTIKFATPGGVLDLEADVVHVVDAANAAAFNQPPGVGVQFVDLSDEVRGRIEKYVDGVAHRISEELTDDKSYEPLDVLIADARRIMDDIQASKLYAALEVDPGASRDEIELRVQTLCERFSDPPPDSPPPKVARLDLVVRQLERASELVANPLRRLHYDFHHGHIRVEERRAAGDDFQYLREVWAQAFPDRVKDARARAERALQLESTSLEQCVQLADEAIAKDPFNQDLRTAREQWAAGQTLGDDVAKEPPAVTTIDLIVGELQAFSANKTPPTHFELLGVDIKASTDEVTKAYFNKSRRFHPDVIRTQIDAPTLQIAMELQTALNTAYRTLNHPGAREAYTNKLVVTSPEEIRAGEALMAFETAKVHLRKGAPAEARELLKSAHASDPKNPHYAATYAWSMIVDRKFDRRAALSQGRELLEGALELAREQNLKDPIVVGQWIYYLGRVFREQGDADRALRLFVKSLELNPHLKEARMERRVLEMRKNRDGEG